MNEEERDLEQELKEEKDRFEAQNQEAFDKEVSGENEIKAAYEKNRERLKKTREESADPDRFQSQLETIQKYTPDLANPREATEFFSDLAIDAGILGRTLNPSDLPGGIALVISRRLTKNPSLQKIIKESTGLGIESTPKLPDESNVGLSLVQKIGKAIDQTGITQPFKIGIRGDLIGAVADGTGTSGGIGRLTQQQLAAIDKSRKELLAPFTQKFKPQQWENFDRFETGIEQVTGRPFKIEAPEPKNTGIDFTLVPDKQRGRPVRTMKKEDIDLNTFNFSNIKQAVERFRRRISGLMQIDRIRSADAGTVDGFTKTSRNINTITAGSNEISSMYFDYLTGYFNRFIRSGKVDNFENAVSLIAPKVKGKNILPDQIQTVKGDPRLIRELRLYTIAPDVYKSGAFSPKDKTYQAKLKTLIRKYATADATDISYKFDAHHIDQIAEGWPLYRGLPKEEIPKMRALVQAYGLEPGNHPDNMLLLLNELHKEFHAVHWPAALERLKKSSTGWNMDKLQKIKTAVGREQYVQNYVREVERSRDEVLERAQRLLDSYADEKNIKRIEITEQQIKEIAEDIKSLGDTPPSNIQKQIDEDPGIQDTTRFGK